MVSLIPPAVSFPKVPNTQLDALCSLTVEFVAEPSVLAPKQKCWLGSVAAHGKAGQPFLTYINLCCFTMSFSLSYLITSVCLLQFFTAYCGLSCLGRICFVTGLCSGAHGAAWALA